MQQNHVDNHDVQQSQITPPIGVILTATAIAQIKKVIHQNLATIGLKLDIKKSGCAGFAYVWSVVTELNLDENDQLFEYEGAKIYIPLRALPYLEGIAVDYVRDGLNAFFKFTNPKAQYTCGCGESFSV